MKDWKPLLPLAGGGLLAAWRASSTTHTSEVDKGTLSEGTTSGHREKQTRSSPREQIRCLMKNLLYPQGRGWVCQPGHMQYQWLLCVSHFFLFWTGIFIIVILLLFWHLYFVCICVCVCVWEREHTCYSGLSITFFLVHRTLDQEMPHPDLDKNRNFTEPGVLDFELDAMTRWEFLWGGVSVLCVWKEGRKSQYIWWPESKL